MMSLPSIQCALPFSLKVWTVQVPTTAGLATGLYTLVMQTPAATGLIFCRACLQSSARGEDEELIAAQVRPTISSATDGSEFDSESPSAKYISGWIISSCPQYSHVYTPERYPCLYTLGQEEQPTNKNEEQALSLGVVHLDWALGSKLPHVVVRGVESGVFEVKDKTQVRLYIQTTIVLIR